MKVMVCLIGAICVKHSFMIVSSLDVLIATIDLLAIVKNFSKIEWHFAQKICNYKVIKSDLD